MLETLQVIWFILWALLWAVYFVLDGFDLGLGSLLPFIGSNEEERRIMYNAAGPFWDGNEVWLISAGGVTFAAFPKVYAVMFSSLYAPLLILLFALIFRAVSFEFRGKVESGVWRGFWDLVHFLSNLVPSLLLGVTFANLFMGIPIDGEGVFHGTLMGLVNGYGIAGAIFFLVMFMLHGSLWLAIKSQGELQTRAVASANLQDFYNLIDVYIDAVFHPRISEDIFRQEGWHVEAEDTKGPWTYKGVVYNEMKGAYSSPDSVLAEQSQQAIFPDMLYSLDSGGNPEVIPDLTYEAFRDFHSRYYHPSNARFFFWGDDPEEKRLEIVAEALQGYTARAVDSAVPLQPRRDTPRQVEVPYAATDGQKTALFTVNWLLGERGDVHQALLMEMLEHILEGLPGSPLRKALISSGLGEDTTGCGLETDLRQMYYSTGLKGVDPRKVQDAEMLIFETLADLAEDGIDPAAVEAAVNSVEFSYRENNSGRFPRGLSAMIQALSTWLYDGDPLAPLAWEGPLAEIKARLAAGEKVFENAIREGATLVRIGTAIYGERDYSKK